MILPVLSETRCACGAPAGAPDVCDAAVELHGDDTPCVCCDHCRKRCAEDV